MIHPPRQEYLDMILHETTKRLFASTTFSVIKERFLETGADIYPKQALEEMLRDKYDPIIFGYVPDFEGNPPNQQVKGAFMELAVDQINEYFHEFLHISLGDLLQKDLREAEFYLKDVLNEEVSRKRFESKKSEGTLTPQDITSFTEHFQKIEELKTYHKQNPSFELLCWVLMHFYYHCAPHSFGLHRGSHPYAVSLMETSDMLRWKREAEGDRELKKQLLHGESVLEDAGVAISHYTDIQRDVHNLQELNQFRPGVIAISTMHALAYDMLLNRDGSRSFYFPCLHPEQLVEFSLRSEVHSVYRERIKS